MCTGMVIDILVELCTIDVCADVGIDVSTVVVLAVKTGTVITLDCIVKVSYAVEVLTGECAEAIIGDAPGIGTEVNASGLATVMTALEFALPESLGKPLFLCS